MDTVIIILIPNEIPNSSIIKEGKKYVKEYVGLSRYDEISDGKDGYRNAIVINSILSTVEKNHLIQYFKEKELEIFFIESEDDPFDNEQTIKII